MSATLTPAERAALLDLIARQPVWRPLPGPQTAAYASEADIIGYGGAAGGGKGRSLDTRVPTPTGWTTMGALRVGDQVFDERGEPCTVTHVSPVSNRACFRLVFDDGSAVVADDVHRWLTFDARELAALTRRDPAWRAARRARRPAKGTGKRPDLAARNAEHPVVLPAPAGTVRDTAEIAATLRTSRGRANHAIPVAGALVLPDAYQPVPAYTLGAWLGDGASRNGQITSVDAGVWQQIEADGFEVRHYHWDTKQHSVIGLKERLRDLGVLENKHIPTRYLRGSFKQRLALLQGLMDTDGHAALDGGCEYDGVNECLVRGVLELVRSLGIKATLQTGTAKLNGRQIGAKWRVKFTTTLPVFRLPRKLERLPAAVRRTSAFRYVVACEPIESVPTVCIAVDSPSRLYLADEAMIPTHNTDLACGMALTRHHRTMIFRRNGTEIIGIHQRMMQLLGGREGFNGQVDAWTLEMGGQPRLIEYGSVPNAGDETKYQGRPHDLLIFDEAVQFPRHVILFLRTWLRHEDPRQKCQMLLTFNPPTSAEGQWVKDFFGPWLDDKHPRPAAPGELRWYLMLPGGEEREVDGPVTEVIDGIEVRAMSRTFFPAKVTDNPYYMKSGYASVLNSLEEPFRSMMLKGDFSAGMEDDPFAMFPSAWVQLAMDRWREPEKLPTMDSVGADIARGGRDNTVLICRHGQWYSKPIAHKGKHTPDGPTAGALIMAAARDGARLHVDAIGVGSSPVDWLRERDQPVIAVNVAESPTEMSRSGAFGFSNLRTQLMWKLHEALDPMNNTGICLPPSRELRADMAAVTWEMKGKVIQALSREKIIERLGRSPDYLSALMLASMDSPDLRALEAALSRPRAQREHNPVAVFDEGREYNPMQF